jgi:SAM-dependent methyltransferase
MSSKQELIAYYTHYTQQSFDHKYDPVKRELELPSLRRICETQKVNGMVFGAGCGDGTDYLLVKGLADTFLGVDICPAEVRKARETYRTEIESGKVQFGVADLTLPLYFLDNAFDTVVSFNIPISHIDNPTEILHTAEELYRILQPGGRAVIQLLNAHSITSIVNEKEDEPVRPYHHNVAANGCFHVPAFYHTTETIDQFFVFAGFKVADLSQRSVLFGRYTPLREIANKLLTAKTDADIEAASVELEKSIQFYEELNNPIKPYTNLAKYICQFWALLQHSLTTEGFKDTDKMLSDMGGKLPAEVDRDNRIQVVKAIPQSAYTMEESLMQAKKLDKTMGGHTLVAILEK